MKFGLCEDFNIICCHYINSFGICLDMEKMRVMGQTNALHEGCRSRLKIMKKVSRITTANKNDVNEEMLICTMNYIVCCLIIYEEVQEFSNVKLSCYICLQYAHLLLKCIHVWLSFSRLPILNVLCIEEDTECGDAGAVAADSRVGDGSLCSNTFHQLTSTPSVPSVWLKSGLADSTGTPSGKSTKPASPSTSLFARCLHA